MPLFLQCIEVCTTIVGEAHMCIRAAHVLILTYHQPYIETQKYSSLTEPLVALVALALIVRLACNSCIALIYFTVAVTTSRQVQKINFKVNIQ